MLPPLLHWHFIRNSGAAFSIGEDYTWVFTIIMSVVAAAIVFYAGRKVRSLWWSVALGFLLGGVLGNLTDRLFREPGFGVGHVVDFIALPNFAIFNIADAAIVGSVILWCLLTFTRYWHGRPAGREWEARGRRGQNGPGSSAGAVPGAGAVPEQVSTVALGPDTAGKRVDAALAQLLGISRSSAAALVQRRPRDDRGAGQSANPSEAPGPRRAARQPPRGT